MASTRCQNASGDGCGRLFPNKVSAGLCKKCSLLSTLSEGTEEFQSTVGYPQCKGCGGTWRFFQGHFCDECDSKENKAPNSQAPFLSVDSLSAQAVEASKVARAHAMDIRLNKKRINPLHTTAGLNYARTGTPGTQAAIDKIQVQFEVRIKDVSKRNSQSTDPSFGKWGRPWAKDAYLSEVLDDSLTTVNLTWEKDKAISLIREEVEFRFSQNKVFLPGTQHATVGETYTKYMTGDLATFYQPNDSRAKAAKGPTLFLELCINKIAFDKRALGIQGSGTSDNEVELDTRKRRLESCLESDILASSTVLRKKPRTQRNYSQLSSRFVRSTVPQRGVSNETYTTIKYIRAEAGYVADTSDIEIVWPSDASTVHHALISSTPFAEGATKKVYKLMLGSDLFVAKRFFEAGSGSVNALENNIQVSDGFLIQEQDAFSTTLDDATVWLVEPRRTTSVIKFSGTLRHPTRDDKTGKTITAFAHFVYEVSKKTLVFADIQGSPMSINNRDGIVLFDLMTHSIDGSSGVGDHGQAGITTFLEQHKCDFLCDGLDLPSLGLDEGSESA